MIPAPIELSFKAYVGKDRSGRGNVTDSWDTAKTVNVIGWYVNNTHRPQVPGHERRRGEVQVLVPHGFTVKDKDIFVIPGIGDMEVVGFAQDYNNGPFGWKPGLVVNLDRVVG